MSEESIGEKMAALWGRENLRPVSAQLLDGLTLSDAERRLLTEYGLPVFWGEPLGAEAVLLGSHTFLAGFAVSSLQDGAVIVSKYPQIVVNTNLARFAACLVLHRTLLAEGAALARRLYSGSDVLSDTANTVYRAAMVTLMDYIEREMREADPAAWQGITGTRLEYYGMQDEDTYWPQILGEYDWYAMWDAEDVYARWAGIDQCQT